MVDVSLGPRLQVAPRRNRLEMPTPQIAVSDNFLSAEDQKAVWEFLQGPGWAFGAYSEKERGSRYFYKHFAGYRLDPNAEAGAQSFEDELHETPLIAGIWRRLKGGLLKGHALSRCYANGMPSGVEGGLHLDSNVDTHLTTIYYPHLNWHPNFGGETVFFDQSGADIIAAVYPRPNRLAIFPGTVPHVARPVSRAGPDLRITLMFKTMPVADAAAQAGAA